MPLDREYRREGHGCVHARRRQSTATHGETEEGFGLGCWGHDEEGLGMCARVGGGKTTGVLDGQWERGWACWVGCSAKLQARRLDWRGKMKIRNKN